MKLMKIKNFQRFGKQSFPKLLNKNEKGLKLKISKNKKAVELSLNVVIIAAILLVVAVVVIMTFTKLFGKETAQIGATIDSLGDADGDNIVNMLDKCPCDAGEKDFKGCKKKGDMAAPEGFSKNTIGNSCTEDQKKIYENK